MTQEIDLVQFMRPNSEIKIGLARIGGKADENAGLAILGRLLVDFEKRVEKLTGKRQVLAPLQEILPIIMHAFRAQSNVTRIALEEIDRKTQKFDLDKLNRPIRPSNR